MLRNEHLHTVIRCEAEWLDEFARRDVPAASARHIETDAHLRWRQPARERINEGAKLVAQVGEARDLPDRQGKR